MHIEKKIRRYSLVDAGSLTRLMRDPEIAESAGCDFQDIHMIANFIENNLRASFVFVMGIDPRHECFVFNPMHTTVCFVGHFSVRQDHRGPKAAMHLVQSAKYVFDNSPCRAIMGFIRESNREARMLASHIGMRRIGKTDKTITYRGELVDEIIYQCTMEDFNKKYGDKYGFAIGG